MPFYTHTHTHTHNARCSGMKRKPDINRVQHEASGTRNSKSWRRVKPQKPIFCEILDARTQQLIKDHPTLGESCHYLVSTQLISKVLAMVAEDRKIAKILNLLFSGVICIRCSHCFLFTLLAWTLSLLFVPSIKSSELYSSPSDKVSFFVLAKRAQDHDQAIFHFLITNSFVYVASLLLLPLLN